RGISRARRDFGIQCELRIDLVRNYGPEVGMEVLDWIESKGDNIISIDIGGSEQKFPPRPFEPVYLRAKKMGLHLVAHAGEAAGPESIWDAVRYLKVEHIGHGVAALGDSRLMDYLVEQEIVLEMCPTSNVKTGAVPSIEAHPIRAFLERGLTVTVSTDDPSMFSTDMNNEYVQLHKVLNFSVEELFKLSLNAVDSLFLPQKQRIGLKESFMKEYQCLMDE
ncbi:adenosine deaminase, partial [Candidatus Bathyarchaeota archaeon]|nr:adenosine deaminase [Candidatus Bathyarchaeota archaeon]